MHAGAAQAAHRAVQSRRGNVARNDLPAIFHCPRQSQGLAAGTGAPVHHAHAGHGADQGGNELAAFVLDLDQSGLEGRPAGDRAPAIDAQAPRRQLRQLGLPPFGGKRGTSLVAVALQQVHAHVERRRFGQRRHLSHQAGAEAGRQPRQQPVRNFQPHRLRHRGVVQRVPGDARQHRIFRAGQWLRRELPAGERLRDAGLRPSLQQQRRRYQQARRLPGIAQPPAEAPAGAQHAPDAIRHGAPVTGADVAAGAKKIVGDGVGGAFHRAFDDLQQIDRGRDARGGGQAGRPGEAGTSGTSGHRWPE